MVNRAFTIPYKTEAFLSYRKINRCVPSQSSVNDVLTLGLHCQLNYYGSAIVATFIKARF